MIATNDILVFDASIFKNLYKHTPSSSIAIKKNSKFMHTFKNKNMSLLDNCIALDIEKITKKQRFDLECNNTK